MLLFLAKGAFSQETLTLREAVQKALDTHPLIEAAARDIAVASGDRRQAGFAPDPTFTFQQENIRPIPGGATYWSFTDTFAFIQQPIETGGKRRRRVEVAALDIKRAELELELARKQIAGRVGLAYWQAAGAQRIRELLNQNVEAFQQIVEYHRVRVQEGAMAEADLLRIRLESERLKLAAHNAGLEADRRRIGLWQEMGLVEPPAGVALDPPARPGPESMEADAQRALAQRTEMQLVRLAVEQARAGLELTRANWRPTLTALGGYKRSGGFDSLVAGVSVPLPLRNRNQGSRDAAVARIGRAQAMMDSTAAMVRAEVAAAERNYEVRRTQILDSLTPMLARAAQSAEIAEAAYREGGSDLLRLVDAQRLRIETETLYHQALAEFRQSRVELDTAMGVIP